MAAKRRGGEHFMIEAASPGSGEPAARIVSVC
jgi:hypothetical protein